MNTKPVLERFLAKVFMRPDGCWQWTGAYNSRGYGCMRVEGKAELAHRMAYRLYIGEIPRNKAIMHSCGNVTCVNPDHLLIGGYVLADDTPAAERFWSLVNVREEQECWDYTGCLDAAGYGQFLLRSGQAMEKAHRASWMLVHSEAIPPRMQVCHACDNPSCVNPYHLFLGSAGDNMRDMASKGRWAGKHGRGEHYVARHEKRRLRKMTDYLIDIAPVKVSQ